MNPFKKNVVLSSVVKNQDRFVSIHVSKSTYERCSLGKFSTLKSLKEWEDLGEDHEYRYKYSSESIEEIRTIEEFIREEIRIQNLYKDMGTQRRLPRKYKDEEPLEGYDIFLKVA